MFTAFDPPSVLVAVFIAGLITLLLRQRRTQRYIRKAASYSGRTLAAYERMLEGNDDWGDTILRGIDAHESRLLLQGEVIFSRMRAAKPEPLFESRVSVENLLNRFFFACVFEDDNLEELRSELSGLRQRLSSLSRDARFSYELGKDCRRWISELEEWEHIMLFLRPRYIQKNFRSMNL